MFKKVASKPDFVKMERRLLDWWSQSGLDQKYLHKNDNSEKKFSFLDGPITANNPMGVHHAWGRTLKDLYQRYHNMKGEKQRFQNGFDCQGLWVEVEVEKELGFKDKKDIEKYGIAKFVEKCKERVRKYSQIQTDQSKRLGYFMDWDHSYYTMSDENNYMIWHFLKKCQLEGNLYKGEDVVPWCPRCGTAISQHEIDAEGYQQLTHDSIYLRFPVVKNGKAQKDEFLMVWTTTPWTVPADTLVAVSPEIKYAQVESEDKKYWLAQSLVEKIFGKKLKSLKVLNGQELIKKEKITRYLAPFDDLPIIKEIAQKAHQHFHAVVLSQDLVNEAEGTGLVHIVPGTGSEDYQLTKKELKWDDVIFSAVDEAGFYHQGFGQLSGQSAKLHPEIVINFLKEKDNGLYLFKIEPYTHSYPVCWRCNEELIWRVVDEWYIAMDHSSNEKRKKKSLRQRMIAVAKKIKWLPEWGLDRELDWLNNMHDWLISKKRYWGLALPIWQCPSGHFEVIGSKEELGEKAIAGWDKFKDHSPHRPWVDQVKIKCPKCQSLMSRIPDVGNPWLDAGIVAYSTYVDPKTKKLSYTTDKKYWQKWFPADFITECFPGQFRNWFYSLIAMSTVLEGKNPYQTLLGYALVRDEKGEEMHKSKGNAIEFNEAAEKMGVDVMRWLFAKQNHELNLNFGFSVADQVRRQFHLTLWNVYKFFVSYANLSRYKSINNQQLTINNQSVLDQWILSKLHGLVKEVTNRLDNFDNPQAASSLEGFLVNDLSLWYVRRSRDRINPSAEDKKDKEACLAILYHILKTFSLLLASFNPFIAEEIYQNLTDEESVHLADWPQFNPKLIDRKLEEQMVLVRQIIELGHSERKNAGIKVRQPLQKITINNQQLTINNQLIQLIKEELNVKEVEFIAGKEGLSVELDTELTPELKAEGEARELIRQIQDLRKKKGCQLDEKIVIIAPSWPKEFAEQIKRKTLAEAIIKGEKLAIKL